METPKKKKRKTKRVTDPIIQAERQQINRDEQPIATVWRWGLWGWELSADQPR